MKKQNLDDITHYYDNQFGSKTAVISCLYDGPHAHLYIDRANSLAGTHLEFSRTFGYDYFCFNGNVQFFGYDLSLKKAVLFGMYKWICAYYVVEVLKYESVVVLDFDTRFISYDCDFPDYINDYDLLFSNPHPFNYHGLPTVVYFLNRYELSLDGPPSWFNTGLFKVGQGSLDFEFLRDYVSHAYDMSQKKYDFFMTSGDFDGDNNNIIFRANDEVFAQVFLRKYRNITYNVFDYRWNTGHNHPDNILLHFTDKNRLLETCDLGNDIIST